MRLLRPIIIALGGIIIVHDGMIFFHPRRNGIFTIGWILVLIIQDKIIIILVRREIQAVIIIISATIDGASIIIILLLVIGNIIIIAEMVGYTRLLRPP